MTLVMMSFVRIHHYVTETLREEWYGLMYSMILDY